MAATRAARVHHQRYNKFWWAACWTHSSWLLLCRFCRVVVTLCLVVLEAWFQRLAVSFAVAAVLCSLCSCMLLLEQLLMACAVAAAVGLTDSHCHLATTCLLHAGSCNLVLAVPTGNVFAHPACLHVCWLRDCLCTAVLLGVWQSCV